MKVVGTGFLSEDGVAQAQVLAEKLAPILDVAERTVRLCHEGLVQSEVQGQETLEQQQRVSAVLMLTRLLEIAESAIYQARGGFGNQVTSATREFLEAYFLFCNFCESEAFVTTYFASDLRMRQKIITQAARHQGEPFGLINQYATDEVKADLKTQVDQAKATELDVYKHANNIGCASIYDSLYRTTSAVPHSSPRSLEIYVSEVDGMVSEVRRGPQLGSIAQRLNDQAGFLLNARHALDILFGRTPPPEIDRLREELKVVELPE